MPLPLYHSLLIDYSLAIARCILFASVTPIEAPDWSRKAWVQAANLHFIPTSHLLDTVALQLVTNPPCSVICYSQMTECCSSAASQFLYGPNYDANKSPPEVPHLLFQDYKLVEHCVVVVGYITASCLAILLWHLMGHLELHEPYLGSPQLAQRKKLPSL
ncbi:hypothetical protein B0O99DRAFT_34026 [Bisporella sp. PMI_857]|nr:hypothetical protein B0O99DRAFT_34026 [Bisporella sp. PMI_857]